MSFPPNDGVSTLISPIPPVIKLLSLVETNCAIGLTSLTAFADSPFDTTHEISI